MQALRKSGHEAYAPTLTGLGERIHLMSPSINLDTHIADVVNLIKWEELSDVVLVGHSYGGMVITGVADALSDRIRSLVYLDAFVPKDGEALVNFPAGGKPAAESCQRVLPGAAPRCVLRRQARSRGDRRLPARRRCRSLASPRRSSFRAAIDRIKKKTYVYCNVPAPTTFTQFYEKLKDDRGLAGAHAAMHARRSDRHADATNRVAGASHLSRGIDLFQSAGRPAI